MIGKKKEVDYPNLYGLDSNELKSILKSNVIPWEIRRNINIQINLQFVKEFVPIIIHLGLCVLIRGLLKELENNGKSI